MSLVLDASLTLAWYFDDETTQATEAMLDRVGRDGAVVPGLWRIEVAHAFQAALRRKRIAKEFRDAAFAALSRLPITIDQDCEDHAWTTAVPLADRFGLTVYDATYLELAQRRGMPIATLDQALGKAADALAITRLGS